MSEVRNTLNERGGRYGRFDAHAGTAERFIRLAQFGHAFGAGKETEGWARMQPDQRHAIRYILDKIARILEGDPDYTDNWHDIAGYATLIEDRLNGTGLYAASEYDNKVYQSQTNGTGKCQLCYAALGDVHAPDCKYFNLEKASPTG